MSWLGEHKNQVRSFLIGLSAVGITVFAASGIYLYRERQATEAMIEMRRQESMEAAEQQEAEGPADGQQAGQGLPAERKCDIRLDADKVIWQGKTYRRNNYIKAILCMGVDRSDTMTETKEFGASGQSDGIFLLAQDTARNKLKILMIPRDTMTEITLTNPERTETWEGIAQLTLAFGYGDGREGSCLNMSEAVSGLLYGLPMDQYLATDTVMLGELNDAVGGVTVTVPTPGMEKADPAFVQGTQVTLEGKQAEKFVRYRDIEVDHSAIFRMSQQKEYITKYFEALQRKSREDSQIVTKLFDMLEGYMLTDMTKDQYLKLALDAVASEGIRAEDFYMVPGTGVTTEEYDEFYVTEEELIPLILDLFFRIEK